jgi:hypothetical protein
VGTPRETKTFSPGSTLMATAGILWRARSWRGSGGRGRGGALAAAEGATLQRPRGSGEERTRRPGPDRAAAKEQSCARRRR